MSVRPMPPVHPAAAIFPLLGEQELQALADDIRANGQRDAIILHRGQILDGRNRWLACERAEVRPRIENHDGIKDPVAFVLSKNLHRRHLSESQRAMVAARLATMKQGARTDLAQIPAMSQPDAADRLRVSRSSVQAATKVLREAAPELVSAVEAGRVAVSAAADLVKLAPERQREIATAEDPREMDRLVREAFTTRRRPGDVYLSSGGFVRPLLAFLGPPQTILECCAGGGDLVGPLRAAGHRVVTNDIDPARETDYHLDATRADSWELLQPADWIVSNLPFNVAIEILPHALEHARAGVAVILRLSFLEPTEGRAPWLAAHPLTRQIVLPRYSFTGDGKTDSVTCAWMVWIHGAEPAIYIPQPDEHGMPGAIDLDGDLRAVG